MAVTNQQILDAVVELRGDVKLLNGRLRESENVQAALVQWRRDHDRDHEQASDDMADEVKDLRRRQNIGASVLGVTQLVSSTISAIFLGNRAP